MAHIRYMGCCGVGEIFGLDVAPNSLESILRQAKDCGKGMLVAYFVKYGKKWQNPELMKEMLKHGFKKQRKFINPNSGNTIQPLYYTLKKKERMC